MHALLRAVILLCVLGSVPGAVFNSSVAGESARTFPVLTVNYERVRKPFEVCLWILLASLMKLGEFIHHTFMIMNTMCTYFNMNNYTGM